MNEEIVEIGHLIIKKVRGELSGPELQRFEQWLAASEENRRLLDEFSSPAQLAVQLDKYYGYREAEALGRLQQLFPELKPKKAKTIPIVRWAAAAAVLIAVATGSYFIFFNKAVNQQHEPGKQSLAHDVPAPVTNRATITLANGQTIFLDSANNGTLAMQGNVSLIKTADGQVAYNNPGLTTDHSPLTYNTLSNPRGSKVIDMTLADGSHVWLDAGSSVTYPVTFAGNERRVTITGQAYFEVTHDADKPFMVSKGDMSITVLGTHFNVNAYDDAEDIKVTLLEGSVKTTLRQAQGDKEVESKKYEVILKPGEQAQIREIRDPIRVIRAIHVIRDIDVEQVMAWKNGKFDFGEGVELKEIMRQVARWYDVDVEYRTDNNIQFGGSVTRQVNVSKVLEKFELTGQVHFVIEGKKVIVNP